ncbi:hypothetical protein MTCD1_03726 [Colwellia marinimaniae]|uniref:Uncharacterized protein n=1 Tax=Colwellia marinimaniae TaxID=1513592 RepID=A0ABQ0N0B2_9GAMM|nr:hypothetical protein MTCD1_03726 [Colwellia marinimaniae]
MAGPRVPWRDALHGGAWPEACPPGGTGARHRERDHRAHGLPAARDGAGCPRRLAGH